MTSLELLRRSARQYQRGHITAEEFTIWLSDSFAGDPELSINNAVEVAGLIPPAVRHLVMRQIDVALSPGYIRQAFKLGGRTKEEEHAAALRETAREQAWAAALRSLLS